MTAKVHASACVDPSARLADDVVIGPGAVIGPDVELGPGARVGPHCVLEGPAQIGEGTRLSAHAVVGSAPQDLKYGGERTIVRLGARNQVREFVTINRGTEAGGGETVVGDDNLFMTGAHVAHDCRVGDGTVFANNATLGGHVTVGDAATIGAFSAVHQFCRVGDHAFVGGFTVATKDVLPFMRTVGSRGDVHAYGVNRIGLERRGMDAAVIEALSRAFREIRRRRSRWTECAAELMERLGHVPEVARLVAFVEEARRSRGYHA